MTTKERLPFIAWVIWGLAAFYYFAQYILRLIPSVIQTELMTTFELTATVSGYLGGLFYYPYIIMQMPIGALVDKFGARTLLAVAAFTCGLSAFLFAQAETLPWLFVSRFLLGLSSAAGFVCALKLAKVWFPGSMLGLLIGLTQALGMLGASSGGVVSSINASFGYHSIFWGMGLIFVVLAIFSLTLIKDKAPTHSELETQNSTPIQSFRSLFSKVFRSKYTWINACYAGFIYAPIQVLGEYWGVVFLSNVYTLTQQEAAWVKSMLFVGWFVGGPFAGILSDRIGRKPMMLLSALGCTVILTLLFMGFHFHFYTLMGLCFLLGVANTGLIASYAASGELHSTQAAGLSMAIANMFSILFGALLIPICGKILDLVAQGTVNALGEPVYSAQACLVSFSLLPICSVLALICAIFMKETYKRSEVVV